MSTATERRRIAREARDATPGGPVAYARRVKDDAAADDASVIAAGAAPFDLLAHSLFTRRRLVASASLSWRSRR